MPYTHFLPDDVVLSAFTQIQTNRYFLKAERKEPNHFTLFYSYGNAELPEIKGLNFNEKNAFVVEPSLNQDTITYWLRDTMLVNQDTLHMQVSYLANDSLGKLVKQTDTFRSFVESSLRKTSETAKGRIRQMEKATRKRVKRKANLT